MFVLALVHHAGVSYAQLWLADIHLPDHFVNDIHHLKIHLFTVFKIFLPFLLFNYYYTGSFQSINKFFNGENNITGMSRQHWMTSLSRSFPAMFVINPNIRPHISQKRACPMADLLHKEMIWCVLTRQIFTYHYSMWPRHNNHFFLLNITYSLKHFLFDNYCLK